MAVQTRIFYKRLAMYSGRLLPFSFLPNWPHAIQRGCRTVSLLVVLVLLGCSTVGLHVTTDIPSRTDAALKRLYVGMTEGEAVNVMRPVSLSWDRLTYGGTGAGELCFQVSTTQQIRLIVEPKARDTGIGTAIFPEINSGPEFVVRFIGSLETKRQAVNTSKP